MVCVCAVCVCVCAVCVCVVSVCVCVVVTTKNMCLGHVKEKAWTLGKI